MAKRWLGSLLLFLSLPLAASPLTVSNGASSISVDPGSPFGLFSYTLHGVENMFEQWFWLRLDQEPFERSLDSLPLQAASASANSINLSYADTRISVAVDYTLVGATPLVPRSRLFESILLTNLTANPLVVAFFAETDFDIGGDGGNDTIVGGVNGISQSDGLFRARVTGTPVPAAFQISPFPDIFVSLTDLDITQLSNTGSPFGPGDGSFAFQWNLELAPLDSAALRMDKELKFVSEPGSAMLVVLGVMLLSFFARPRGRRTGDS